MCRYMWVGHNYSSSQFHGQDLIILPNISVHYHFLWEPQHPKSNPHHYIPYLPGSPSSTGTIYSQQQALLYSAVFTHTYHMSKPTQSSLFPCTFNLPCLIFLSIQSCFYQSCTLVWQIQWRTLHSFPFN